MKSLKELYKVGKGPSSSHTMGPQKAAKIFLEKNRSASSFDVVLYGSLAATGKGHMTDVAISEVLEEVAPVNIIWRPQVFLPYHPNGMDFKAYDADRNVVGEWTVYSIGGGALSEGKGADDMFNTPEVYELNTMTDVMKWCERTGRNYWEYVQLNEDESLWDYLDVVWQTMKQSVLRGIKHEGRLPGPLNLPRKAPTYYIKASGYKQSLQAR